MEGWGYVSLLACVITETWEASRTEAEREAISAGSHMKFGLHSMEQVEDRKSG